MQRRGPEQQHQACHGVLCYSTILAFLVLLLFGVIYLEATDCRYICLPILCLDIIIKNITMPLVSEQPKLFLSEEKKGDKILFLTPLAYRITFLYHLSMFLIFLSKCTFVSSIEGDPVFTKGILFSGG